MASIETDSTVSTGGVLGAFATAPLDTDAARAFLQRRLGFFAKFFALMVGGFQLLARVVNSQTPVLQEVMGNRLLPTHLIVLLLFVSLLLRLRTATCSVLELRIIDAVLTIGPPIAIGAALEPVSPYVRPELLLLLVVGHLLLLRAVVVPSTPKRTLLLAISVSIPVVVATYFYYAHHADPSLPPVSMYVVVTAAWCFASTVMTTLVSYSIYGLRQKVVAAAQLGQYTLERRIGQGGMGVVYRARHALLRRPTAIKLLSADRSAGQDLLRFEREVQLTSQLTHPNTIAIYDYGRTPEGVFYYAMEYLDGVDLQQLVELTGPQSLGCVIRIVDQVAGALAEAHKLGLIHRDIKPANVILCERGGVPGIAKVVDFGLVKRVHGGADSPLLSGTQAIMGTPLYLSPEAIAHPDVVDERSDLYALGAVAYFLITGTPVFAAQSVVEVCAHHLHTTPEPPSARCGRPLPPELDRLVLQLLAKEPSGRPLSAFELRRELSRLPGITRWTDDDAAAWWHEVLARRAQGLPRPQRASQTPGTSQTLAVDLRFRAEQ
ncbi:MAG: serine/threonine-protein kinase [Polyangiales bacterium]